MERIGTTAQSAIRLALDAQPTSDGKVRFAWSLAAGPTAARAVQLRLHDGTLWVDARSMTWRNELHRMRRVLLERMASLLGPDSVTRLVITCSDEEGRRPAR